MHDSYAKQCTTIKFSSKTQKLPFALAFVAFVADHYVMEQELVDTVIKELGMRGFGNVMEALGWDQQKFQEGFDLANSMQNMDLIKLLYSNFNQNNILIEFTLLGKARYQSMI